MSDLQTPLARARGLGSAKEGVTHWWRQRLTGVLMLPLVFILTLGLASLPGAGHAEFAGWVAAPFNTVCLVLFIGGVFYHAQLGLQVIIEDYVSNHATRTVQQPNKVIARSAGSVFSRRPKPKQSNAVLAATLRQTSRITPKYSDSSAN